MLASIVAQIFKLKIVSDIIILSGNWSTRDQVIFIRQLSNNGVGATFSNDPKILVNVGESRFTGVLYFQEENESTLKQTKTEHFSHWYKWLVIGDKPIKTFKNIRYDADMSYIYSKQLDNHTGKIYIDDIFVHPTEGATLFPWAIWTKDEGINISNDIERRRRRLNLKQYPLKIVSPVGRYYDSNYNGTFTEYLREDSNPQIDSGIRCTYILSSYIIEMVNASQVSLATNFWIADPNNGSMLQMVQYGSADISGGYLRILPKRAKILDYILEVWPFRVGFTYLSERESSSNMYLEPFTIGVWLSCLATGFILAVMQRITAKKPDEKEGAFIGVLATWLQQDASAVPEGASGRWSFLVMSVSAMLVHAYYTSAIVSSLMSTGRGGPDSVRALADSKYAIASVNYDYLHDLFWNVTSNWTDLEYLKKKKMTSDLYKDMTQGVQLIRDGSTAYHTEYNEIYPLFNTFSDDQLCKLSYLDTIPQKLAWTTATKRSQYTNIFRSSGAWIRETGLTYRELHRLLMKPPPCRTSLLAERVTFGDVAPLLGLSAFGAMVSFFVLGVEILYAKLTKSNRKIQRDAVDGADNVAGDTSVATVEEFNYVD